MEYLGTITTALLTPVENAFDIPFYFKYLLLVTPSNAAEYRVEVKSSASAADGDSFDVGNNTSTQLACPVGAAGETKISIYSDTAGLICKIYGLYDKAQS